MSEITIFIAFVAGVLSFASPCILPLVPAFIAYMSGVSADNLKSKNYNRSAVFLNSLFFVFGFSAVFSILGVLIGTVFSGVAYDFRIWLGRIGGLVVIAFGLYILGFIKIPFLDKEHKIRAKATKYRYLTSFIFGAAFAAGWTPCIGAILGAVLALAIAQPLDASYLLISYSLGLGMPFLLVGLFTGRASELIKNSGNIMKYFNVLAGIFLIMIGFLVFTNQLSAFANLALPAGILSKG
ncbi:MAG: sulfite exporter TauE/SafE family protein [Candidatus Aenigmarchaeota archaeon]|nr:sulfite exporter TauE/SafE family protein [Candidatus Aenigmarchaeota archaeon]